MEPVQPGHDVSEAHPPAPSSPSMTPPIVTVSKAEREDCNFLGVVDGHYDGDLLQLRKHAAAINANYVVLDSINEGPKGSAKGRAFYCPPSCTPDCSPGYVCMSGKCVSACNPPCGQGQQCGADRTCHSTAQ
jgi:hypothetical protein